MESDGQDESGPDHFGAEADIAIAMLIAFSVLGVIGNALVLYGFSMLKPQLTSTIFILTLAGIDFVTCLITIPATVAMELLEFKTPYDGLCKSFHLLVTTTIPFSSFIMVAIAVDRYFCICKPFVQVMTKMKARIIVVSLCLLALVVGILECLNYGVVDYGNSNRNVSHNIHITSFQTELQWLEKHHGKNANTTEYLRQLISEFSETPTRDVDIRCGRSFDLGEEFFEIYDKIYSSFFAVCALVVIVLYIKIYHFILKRRHRRLEVDTFDCCVFTKAPLCEAENTDTVYISQETQQTGVNDDIEKDINLNSPLNGTSQKHNESFRKGKQKKKKSRRKSDSTSLFRQKQEKIRINNIKTALMLSVVALIFIAAFLPAWLMKHKIINFQIIPFYMYFVYNVANPFIYAFMNPDFQQKMSVVMKHFKSHFKS